MTSHHAKLSAIVICQFGLRTQEQRGIPAYTNQFTSAGIRVL